MDIEFKTTGDIMKDLNWYVSNSYNDQGLIIDEKTGENIAVTYKKEYAPLIVNMLEALKEIEKWSRKGSGIPEEQLASIRNIMRDFNYDI